MDIEYLMRYRPDSTGVKYRAIPMTPEQISERRMHMRRKLQGSSFQNKTNDQLAGTKTNVVLTEKNIYDEIIKATETLDDAEVPDTGRTLTVVPGVYRLMKKCPDLTLDCDLTAEQKAKGVIAMVDGMNVIKIPTSRMPENFGFMVSHPVATVAPTKLEDYKVHQDPPGISGELVEGRICYDAFVLDNKVKAIYYLKNAAA